MEAERSSLAELVAVALREDVGRGDVTTGAAVADGLHARAEIVARSPGVVAGTACLVEVYRQVDASVRVDVVAPDGTGVQPAHVIARISGLARSVLTGERVALNFLGRLSGIATLTRKFVDAVAGTGARIADTRKTTPGHRALERTAVRAGGGVNHRFGLDDAVLVKSNHIVAAGSLERALEAVREGRRLGLFTEVEVTSLEDIEPVVAARPDRIMLDNMPLATMRQAVARIRASEPPRVEIEASGGVTLENVAEIARAGVDLISVGALTHSAPALDLSLRIREVL